MNKYEVHLTLTVETMGKLSQNEIDSLFSGIFVDYEGETIIETGRDPYKISFKEVKVLQPAK